VVAASGDEIALSFDATGASVPRRGSARTYLLQAEGYSKEMDLHSVSPDNVGPLPFRAMRAYPPAPGDRRPAAADDARTRVIARPIPRLESLLVAEP